MSVGQSCQAVEVAAIRRAQAGAAREECLKHRTYILLLERGLLPLVQAALWARTVRQAWCTAVMLVFRHPVVVPETQHNIQRDLPEVRVVVEVQRLVVLPQQVAVVLAATVTPVVREAATQGRIRGQGAEAGLARLAARRSAPLPPLPVRVEQVARQSSTGRLTQAVAVAAHG